MSLSEFINTDGTYNTRETIREISIEICKVGGYVSLNEKIRACLTDCGNLKIPFMHIFNNSDKGFSMPQIQTPYIFFVLDGELRLYTPSGIMDYVTGQYSVSAIDTPERAYVLAFSRQHDFLVASVEFSANDMMNIVISLDDELIAHILADDLDEESKAKHDHCVLLCLERMLDTVDESLSMKKGDSFADFAHIVKTNLE